MIGRFFLKRDHSFLLILVVIFLVDCWDSMSPWVAWPLRVGAWLGVGFIEEWYARRQDKAALKAEFRRLEAEIRRRRKADQ